LDYSSADLHDIAKQMTKGKPPRQIEYKREGKYFKILRREWNETEATPISC
jgi:hypothetical protein